jgi:CarboxypepD_reg-like domain
MSKVQGSPHPRPLSINGEGSGPDNKCQKNKIFVLSLCLRAFVAKNPNSGLPQTHQGTKFHDGAMRYRREIFGLVVFILLSIPAFSQKPIKGIVIDSISFSPLPNVNIQLKHTARGTSTDAKGEFRILVKTTDTLVFSLVGYFPEEFSANELEETTLIRLAEEVRILQTITVIPKADQAKPARTVHLAPHGKLMNYGPNGAGINLAYFGKEQREKRKLNLVMAEKERTKNYVSVVTSPEVRERIIFDYNLSEDEYYQILAGFNIENGDSLYYLSSEELIVVMNEYFKRYSHKK